MADSSGGARDVDERVVLDHLTARRFELLLAAVRLGASFTAQDVRAGYEAAPSSLSRDLAALEAAGLLIGDPPATRSRQGRQVRYTVADAPASVFLRLAGAFEDTAT